MSYFYKESFGDHYMFHFPYYINEQDDLFQSQKNLTDVCVNLLPSFRDKKVLEVGCGNGTQAMYIKEKYQPALMVGLDIHEGNIQLANSRAAEKNMKNIQFHVSDAQDMKVNKDNSFDIVLTIESAMHYPEKEKYIAEVRRVLKPGGDYLITDTIVVKDKRGLFWKWLEKRLDLFYWPLDRYVENFQQSGLSVDIQHDITEDVLKAFDARANWFAGYMDNRKWLKCMFNIFSKIQLAKHRYYLKNLSKYYIVAGKKSVT